MKGDLRLFLDFFSSGINGDWLLKLPFATLATNL